MKAKPKKITIGTKEWADSNVNCYSGCSNNCVYCYAKKMTVRFGRKTYESWKNMVPNYKAVQKGYKKRSGRIMFPTSHDITVESLLTEIRNLVFRKAELEIEEEPLQPEVLLEGFPDQTHMDITLFSNGLSSKISGAKSISSHTNSISIEERKPPIPHWLSEYPEFKPYRYEICALCQYFKDSGREKGRDQFKFYPPNIKRNIIDGDASLDKNVFKKLLDHMKDNGFINKEKNSYRLTEKGQKFYVKVKEDNYIIQL